MFFSMIYLLNVRFQGVMAMQRMQGLVASMHANRSGRQSRKCVGSVFNGENRPSHDGLCSKTDRGDSHASLLAHSSTEKMPPSVMVCARRQIGETVPGDSHANRLGRQARGGGVAAAWWQHPDLLNVADLAPYPSILAMHRLCTGYAQAMHRDH